jgi:hypothetical protein
MAKTEQERELEVVALMKRAMDPQDPYTGEDEDGQEESNDS